MQVLIPSFLFLFSPIVFELGAFSLLILSASHNTNSIQCGTDTCIPAGYTCCPDNISGCDTEAAYCYPVDGSYGCCAIGFTCGSATSTSASKTASSSTTRKTTSSATRKTSSSVRPSIISTSTLLQTLTPYVYNPSTITGASSTILATSKPSSTSTATNGGNKVGSGGGRLSWVVAVLLGVLAT